MGSSLVQCKNAVKSLKKQTTETCEKKRGFLERKKCSFVEILLAKPVRICYSNIGVAERHKLGGLTEWLRSLIGNQVRCNSPVGSSPMSSAIETEVSDHFRFFVV